MFPIEFNDSDFFDIASFQLARRLARDSHGTLLPEELDKIKPIIPKVAHHIYSELKDEVLARFEVPGQNFFSCGAASLDVCRLSHETVAAWIRQQLPKDGAQIIISWVSPAQDLAALVDRDLFVDHWADFCYPSSEGVVVWPPGLSFVLRYSHDEIFTFKMVPAQAG